jgi:DNA-binding CsgD family transcriptional regulator
MDLVRNFIIGNMPSAVIVFDQSMEIIFTNRQAELYFKYHALPDEIITISQRIFASIDSRTVKESFPGEINFLKKLDSSSSRWLFRIRICEGSEPFVAVFIIEESLADRMDLNEIRNKFRLTRRETDVVRCVLAGLKNTDIAEELQLSEQTIKDHLSRIYTKFSVGTKPVAKGVGNTANEAMETPLTFRS